MSEEKQGTSSLLHPEYVELPENVIFDEILPRLPVKTLIRFKLVSKKWHSTISSPEFIKSHLKLSISNPFVPSNCVFIFRYDGCCFILNYAAYDRCPDDNPLEQSLIPLEKACLSDYKMSCLNVFLVGSCNGLVCSCIVHFHSHSFSKFEYRFDVYNPLTDQCYSLVFARTSYFRSDLLYGFGYVSSQDDYKQFVGGVSLSCSKIFLYVYSLRSKQWKKVVAFDETEMYINRRCRGTLVNETLHWGDQLEISGFEDCICGFDLVDEAFKYVPLPRAFADNGLSMTFRVCEISGSLCVWAQEFINERVHLWMLKQYRVWDSWMKLFETDMVPGFVNFCGCTSNGKFLVQSIFPNEGSLLLGDLDESPPKYTSIVDWNGNEVVPYVESLVSPFL